ncbi:Amine oxidase family protein [Klebsormidium nitens]|uniref:Amine oxidase family protein n=1 Tax=Klebsormidium nitens TaxID=105231 RepID=A0A1Y1IDK0_KLENI|nr:Amine oxidase family protein [Klebsormidium nitens]|eukprot:GAQ89034.1 Amine oxidase family protein [Klebsormidium nitens]
MAIAQLQQAPCARGQLVARHQTDHQTALKSGPRQCHSGQPHCHQNLGGQQQRGPCSARKALRHTHLSSVQFAAEHLNPQSGFPSWRHCRHVCAAFKWPWEQKDGNAASQEVDAVEAREQENRRNGVPAEETDVVVVGAGLAGLACARTLHAAGIPFRLLEASDGVGGRVRTDVTDDGFLLDRGFQIFLSAYPECKKVLDYEALDLRTFYSGAFVRFRGQFHRVADPFRHPLDGVASLSPTHPIGNVLDKLRVGLLRLKVLIKSDADLLSAPETSIVDKLRREGFSSAMIDRFFRPFLGGIFFDRDLTTTSRLLDFVIKVLALGDNTLPVQGIAAIPEQLASGLPSESVVLNAPVSSVVPARAGAPATVRVAGGRSYAARRGVVVAVDGPQAQRLLGGGLSSTPSDARDARGTVCLYYAAPSAPIEDPVLLLNGDGVGLINNMCFPSSVSPSYAPPGKALVSISLVGAYPDRSDADLQTAVEAELRDWFGKETATWRHLKTYRIPFAQPNQRPPSDPLREVRLGADLYVCGDHRDTATFDGAFVSGRRAAEALMADSQEKQGASTKAEAKVVVQV